MNLSDDQREALRSLPIRELTGVYYRQTAPRRQPLDLPPRAKRHARWHSRDDPWPAYAGDSKLTAMLELSRHHVFEPDVEPVLPTRRLSELHVERLPTIDIVNPLALDVMGLSVDDLRGDRTEDFCRLVAATCWETHPEAQALLVPSTPAAGASVLVIHPVAFSSVVIGDQQLVALTLQRVPEDDGAIET